MVVVNENKSMINNDMVLHSYDLMLPSAKAKCITKDQKVLKGMRAGRIPTTYNFPIEITYKSQKLIKIIAVRVD